MGGTYTLFSQSFPSSNPMFYARLVINIVVGLSINIKDLVHKLQWLHLVMHGSAQTSPEYFFFLFQRSTRRFGVDTIDIKYEQSKMELSLIQPPSWDVPSFHNVVV